jgi:hypothetical protein
MLLVVLYDIPISVFLNSFVIVLVPGPKKVKMAHFVVVVVHFQGFLFLLYSILWVIIIIIIII